MRRASLLAAAALALAAPEAAHAETACADLLHARLAHAEVTAARLEPLKSGQACVVSVRGHPAAGSDVGIEVMIPLGGAWNGKYVQVGNGGLAGRIPAAAIRARAEQGYAAAGTDDGHEGNGRTAVWALGHPERIRDFSDRAVKATTDAAKALIAAQKGEPIRRAYFVGCSAGGREALIEAQRYPDDFDGIVAGAPMAYQTLSYAGRAYMQQALARPGGYLGLEQLKLLQAAALKQCAHGEPFIRDQMACHFDPGVLKCRAGRTANCLTAPQLASARAIYGGRVVGGKVLFPGLEPGAEALRGGWQAWNTGTSQATWPQASAYAMGSQLMKYFVYQDPSLDFLKMDVGAKLERDRQPLARMLDATDPDLTRFERRGGKLIQYHGWNDPAIAPRGSIRYHDAVEAATRGADGFYRLYMIPGMLHCAGGLGPGQVDWLGVLEAWVEQGQAPHELTASSKDGETQLLCPYPAVARNERGKWGCWVKRVERVRVKG